MLDAGKTYYISGPITGVADFERRFGDAEKTLRERGARCVNPAALSASLERRMGAGSGTLPYSAYMRNDVVALACFCDGIILLPGWRGSKGADLERRIASALGMDVLEMDGNGRLAPAAEDAAGIGAEKSA